MRTVFPFLFVCIFSLAVNAQKKNESFQLHIHETASPIYIDGIINEPAWEKAEVAADFFMVLPMDTSHSLVQTEVRMAYDKNNLYLVATCFEAVKGPYMVESLRRDFVFGKNDNFLLFMDPFDDQTNGFSFGANAAGAQWDGTMYEGGKVDLSWDNKWTSAVKSYEDKWIFEAAIPFKSIRYKKGITRWGINFSRNDGKTTEKSSWAPVPRQFPTASLAYSGLLIWDQPPPDAGLNVSLIPYLLGGLARDYANKKSNYYRGDAGIDAKVSITSSLNLDLTVNPDFSQVEVDRQVTNLDRFELFFPEKRQFFLENGDQFNNFGYATIRPFFSRRIGLNAPIAFGGRLSGKLDRNWRIGIMDIQTAKVEASPSPVHNFAVIALQRRVFSRSNLGVIFINKERLNRHEDSVGPSYSAFNRNIGIEYNLASANNLWTGKSIFLKSSSPGKQNHEIVHAANLQYASRKWNINGAYEYVGRDYNAEVGYVPRVGYIRINPLATRLFFPKAGKILSHGPQVSASYFFNESFKKTDELQSISYLVTFRNGTAITSLLSHQYVQLLKPFDPTNALHIFLPVGSEHEWSTGSVSIISRPQKLFTFSFNGSYGGYYAGGTNLTLSTDLGYRFQPYVSILMSAGFASLHLPQPWGNKSFWLLGPRIDVTFTNTIFLTAFLQYNEQQENININTRFQWRFQPASDFFIVYTDNYLPYPLSVRNREIVLKFSYWFNL